MKRLLVLAASVLILGGGQALAQSAEEAIRNNLDAWEAAFDAGDGKALADLYTEDAVLLPPGAERVEGRGKIAEFWQGAIDSGLEDPDLEAVEVVESGDLAYEVGRLSITAPGEDGEPTPVSGKYVVIWQRGDDGTWRLHRDIWNTNPPTPE